MELRHLKYFIVVAEELHFTKAAKKLNIAQPPLSQQIKKLEEELEVELFKRSNRHVELTYAGKVFKSHVHKILVDIEMSKSEIKEIYEGEKGTIKVGFTGSITFDFLPHIIHDFSLLYPNVKILPRQLTSSKQIESLIDGSLDVGILVSPINSVNIKTINLYKEDFVLVIPTGHELSKQEKSLNADDIVKYPLILTSRNVGSVYYDSILNYFLMNDLSPKIAYEVEELQTVISFVSFNLGVSLLPSSMKKFQNPYVEYRELNQTFHTSISLGFKDTEQDKLILNFIDFIKSYKIE